MQAAKKSLPTKQNLLRQKIITMDYCDHCQSQHEDDLHALYLCPKLEELWLTVPAWNQYSPQQMTTFIDLIGCLLAENRDSEFAMVVWALWKRRNELRLGKSCDTLAQLIHQARSKLQDFSLHNASTVLPVGRPPT